MSNKLDDYDTLKLKEARKLIIAVYEYNYVPSSAVTKKLETIIRKLDGLIGEETNFTECDTHEDLVKAVETLKKYFSETD